MLVQIAAESEQVEQASERAAHVNEAVLWPRETVMIVSKVTVPMLSRRRVRLTYERLARPSGGSANTATSVRRSFCGLTTDGIPARILGHHLARHGPTDNQAPLYHLRLYVVESLEHEHGIIY